MIALYLNIFALLAQLFDKIAALKALAPEQPFQGNAASCFGSFAAKTSKGATIGPRLS
jgi:hypothetical protein